MNFSIGKGCIQKAEKPISLDILNSDKKVKCYTGIPSKAVFDGIFGSFGDKVKKIRHWGGPSKAVPITTLKRRGRNRQERILTARKNIS